MSKYVYAKERYAKIGVDTEKAINILKEIPVSLHCWQGDDVSFFEDIKEYENTVLSKRVYQESRDVKISAFFAVLY